MNSSHPSSRDAFLKQFDPSIRPHLIELGKRLTHMDTDVFITMARKATCLVNGLDALGLAALRGTVTSDRVKDMDLSWVKGKRVTLVDDVVVFGSTLATARDELLKAGAADVNAVVLCVSEERWDRTKVQPQPPFLVLPHAQVVSVCATIVDAISVLPMPYAVDYPLFSKIGVPQDSLHALFGLPAWIARDMSSPRQRENGVLSITCTPPAEVLAEFESRLGWKCAPLSLAKIRLYVRQHTEPNSFWQCSALPIVTLQAMDEDELERLWALLKENSGCADDPAWAFFVLPTSKLRLVHYLAASCLAGIWLEGVSRNVLSRPVLGHSRRMLESLFSPPSLVLVQRLVEHRGRLFEGAPAAEPRSDPPDLKLGEDSRSRTQDIAAIRARLTEPFIELERTAERQAQSCGRTVPRETWDAVRQQAPFNRLERGFSYTQLEEHMAHLGSDAAEAVSLFLDQAIDRGIVVPITTARNHVVFRAYRHGEDVLFGKSEIRLFGLALQACSAACNRPVLPHIVVEKLLVLLLRIGVQERFLVPYLGAPGSPGTVGIRFSLHGAVAQSEVSELYGHDEERWLSNLLQEHGHIRKAAMADGPGTGFKVESIVEASIYTGADNKAVQVGSLIGYLHRPNARAPREPALLSTDELILVATCVNETEVAAALAAEIDIYCRAWPKVSTSCKSKTAVSSEGGSQTTDVHHWLRKQRAYIAINSAKWKYEQHTAGVPHRLIYKDIPQRISDPLYRTIWTAFWPVENTSGNEGQDPQVADLLQREANWVYESNVYTRLLLLSLSWKTAAPTGSLSEHRTRERAELFNDIEAIASAFITNCPGCIEPAVKRDIELARNRISESGFDPARLRDYALTQLDSLVLKGRSLLAEAAVKVGNFGRVLAVTRFPHVLHIDIGAPAATHRSLFDRGGKIIRSIVARARREGSSVIEQIPKGDGSVLRGFWVCGRGPLARKWLIQLATEVMASTGQHVPVRSVLFAELPRGVQLIRAESENRFLNPSFWERASVVIDRQLGPPARNELHIVTDQEFLESIRTEVRNVQISPRDVPAPGDRVSYHLTKTAQAKRIELAKATAESASHLVFPMRLPPNPSEKNPATNALNAQRSSRWHYDVGILAIVPNEIRAILDHLSPGKKIEPDRAASSGRIYYRSEFPAGNGQPLRVVVTQTLTQGNRSIVSAYDDMCADYRPRWIVLLGVAGSIHKDAKLTDVVVAEQSIYYDKRAETESGANHRGEQYRIDPTVLSVVNTLLVDSDECDAAPGSFASKFTLHLGPVGTGEAVVKFKDAEVRQWLTGFNEKTLALETEAGGFGQAFYEMKLNPDRGPQGTLVIRGISDHADHTKDNKWQYPAARNCCRVLDRIAAALVRFGLMEQ